MANPKKAAGKKPAVKNTTKKLEAAKNIQLAVGHNRGLSEFLVNTVKEIEVLEAERAATNSKIKQHYANIKGSGFSVLATRFWVGKRRLEKDERQSQMHDIRIIGEGIGEWQQLGMNFDNLEPLPSPRGVESRGTPVEASAGALQTQDPAELAKARTTAPLPLPSHASLN